MYCQLCTVLSPTHHSDDGPVEGGGHGVEHGAGLVLLPDVGQAREDEHPHDDHQHQQPQLLVADSDRFE